MSARNGTSWSGRCEVLTNEEYRWKVAMRASTGRPRSTTWSCRTRPASELFAGTFVHDEAGSPEATWCSPAGLLEPVGDQVDDRDVIAGRGDVPLQPIVQRGEVEPGEPAGVSGGVLTGPSDVVHAANHLPVGGLGDARLASVKRAESARGESFGGELAGD